MKQLPQAVIVAAGESSRFWPLNLKHKCLIKIMGKPLIWHTLEGLRKSNIKEIIIVQGSTNDIEEGLRNFTTKGLKINYVVQKRSRGTGNAIWQAKKFITGPFIVTGPHKVDLGDYLPKLLGRFQKNKNKVILVGEKTARPWDFGVLKFQGKRVLKIAENPPKGKEPSDIKSTETYILPSSFFDYYKKVPQKEENLIDAINHIIKKKGADFILLNKESASLKYPWDLLRILKILFESKSFQNKIASSAVISRSAIVDKNVYIGKNTRVFEGAIIKGPSYIGNNCIIGNNTVIRGYTNIEDGAIIGTFTEVKNSICQENFHSHSNYIGNSIFGKECRIGAGTITANRRLDRQDIKTEVKGEKIDTGLDFLGAIVGENTRIGINVSLMPGVLIGSNSTIYPGTVVYKNIPGNTVIKKKITNRLCH